MLVATNPRKIHSYDWKFIRCNEDNEAVYAHRFCAYKNEGVPILYGVISVNPNTLEAYVDVYNYDDTLYYPYYYVRCGNYEPILNIINKKINNVLKYYKIKEVQDGINNYI